MSMVTSTFLNTEVSSTHTTSSFLLAAPAKDLSALASSRCESAMSLAMALVTLCEPCDRASGASPSTGSPSSPAAIAMAFRMQLFLPLAKSAR